MAGLLTTFSTVALALLPHWAAAMGPDAPFLPPASRSTATATAGGTDTAVAASGLRGVRLGSAPAALIDGFWIAPGQPVRGARLAGVRIDAALLRHSDGRTERLALFPPPAATPASDDRGTSNSTDSVQGQP